jgi:hypothetical protein
MASIISVAIQSTAVCFIISFYFKYTKEGLDSKVYIHIFCYMVKDLSKKLFWEIWIFEVFSILRNMGWFLG